MFQFIIMVHNLDYFGICKIQLPQKMHRQEP